ncbi:septum formation family protein [Asanoa sp. NPDC050611]|uniref:septum formation family protein n=1 Tax=Asanoa sp. NPDC050611 TaxID=3157098 RepID=UPI003409FA00
MSDPTPSRFVAEPPRRAPAPLPVEDGYLPPEPPRRGFRIFLVALGAAVLACGGGLAWAATHRAEPQKLESLGELGIGTCFDWIEQELSPRVPVVNCDDPHDAQVFARHLVDGQVAWPGVKWFQEEYGPRCERQLENYAPDAYEDPAVAVGWVSTDEVGWRQGYRWVSCVAGDPDNRRSGPLH